MANRQQADNLSGTDHINNHGPRGVLLALLGLVLASFSYAGGAPAIELDYQVLQKQPLPSAFFTQGLEIHQGQLLHSSGLYGKSKLVSRPLHKAAQRNWQYILPKRYFAEGLTVLNNTVYLLSWREQTLWRFDVNSGKLLSRGRYQGEGWGLSHTQEELIRSDGSDTLFFHDPDTLAVTRRLAVTRNGQAVKYLNELEFAQGLIWANIWQSNEIIAIDPDSGQVLAVIDITQLAKLEAKPDPDAVSNGIAYHPDDNSFWVTGKNWSHLYQLRLDTSPLTPSSTAKQPR